MEHIREFREFINESVIEDMSLDEGLMSNIHQLAQDAKDAEAFMKNFFKEFGDKIKKDKGSIAWLKELYADAKSNY